MVQSPLTNVFRVSLVATALLCWGIPSRLIGSIASENALTGNLPSEWDVNGIGDPSIQGFATDFSVNRGQTVEFKINTTATAYGIDIYRLGYYGGRGARKVATINPSASLPQTQPAFVSDAATGLIDCGNWAVSASWAVPSTATSGVYIARPVRTDTGGASHIVFIVRDDAGQSDFLFQTADTTWQAYNNYGGMNLYRYRTAPPYRAYKVSYNRPFNNRGATQFAERESFLFNSEYPMIRWMEANGYNVSYASGIDTDRLGSAALLTHKVFLSVGHDEYWSGQQRANVEAARAGGVNLGFFSGNEMFWKTRWEDSIAGTSTVYRTLVCYKETRANAKIDPSAEWTGTWRDPRFSPPSDGGRPENAVTGQFWVVDAFRNDPIDISSSEGKMRFWRNTSIAALAAGQSAQLPVGVLGFEWNEVRDNGFLPPGLGRMSTTTFAVDGYMQDYGSTVAPGIATHSLTLYRHGSGALVFGAGTVQWPWGLDATHDFAGTPTDVRMQQATVNLFADMGVQPATLQAGLLAATASTDTIAPMSVIQMSLGATLPAGYPVTIFGTATDTGGGVPAGVEFSYDGGATWHLAAGASNWSGTWTPYEPGVVTLKSRAVDDSGRIENPGPGINATVVGGLINGSFESDFTGWTATGNVVAGPANGVATDGNKIVAFNGSDLAPDGVISQTFATTAGQTYTLTLDQGVLAYNTNSQTLQVTVTGSGSLLSQSVTINGLGGGTISWVPRSFTFVSNGASSTLTLRDQSATTGSLDMLLDKVRVIATTLPQAATPTFNPAGGTYSAAQSVTLASPSPGAAIYYTTNGSTPTTSSTFYTTPVTVAATTTIKAMAVVPGLLNSAVASATYTIQSALPAAPGGLTATAATANQVNLAWTDNANNETGFKIERKSGAGGTYAQIATVGANVATYANTGLTASTTYFYRVRATNALADSAYSPEASATTAAAPVLLTNGSFESNFTGWTVTGNAFIETTPNYTATDGVKLASFNGTSTSDVPPTGVLSQAITTVPGTTYTLAFDMGATGAAALQQKLRVTVDGTGNLLTQDVTKTSNGTFTSQWTANSFTFVANSTTATLTFSDISTVTDGVDSLLDNVRVTGLPNGPPVVADDSATIHSGQKVRLAVLANDSGAIDSNTLEIVSPPATGTATVESSGEILYSHSGIGTAPVSFTYRVSGAGGPSPVATVSITISSALRIPNDTFNVPTEPPPTAVQVVPAYPGVTFTNPLCFVSPPGDTKRLFVCELGGKIKVIPDVTAANLTSSLMLDLVQVITTPPRVPAETWVPGPDGEAGLLGLAFHPDYATNGYFYVAYMVVKATDSSVWYHRLSRFTVPAAQIGQPTPVANSSSERILIEQRDRNFGLNGGDLHFGADGYLYWSIGDEGHSDVLTNNSQRIDLNFFGAMLRIDVDKKPGNLEPNAHPNPAAAGLGVSSVNAIPRDEIPVGSGQFFARYSVPIDNPYVSTSKGGTWNGAFNGSAISAANLPYVRSEFWAVGLRSPWRFSIDAPTGDIWVGDVGLHTYEELDVVTKGGNYGWAYREGLHARPFTPPARFTSTDPLYEYVHNDQPGDSTYQGNSIIGGVVYRGSRFASLTGAYIFGDHVSGHVWALRRPGGVVTVERIADQPAMANFGVDPSNGDVLTSDYFGGRIMRVVTTTPASGFPATLSATGLFADLTDLSPAPGLLPYTPNLAFWSDYAVKRRWFTLPDATSKMTWSRDGSWTFPAGEIWVKHFDLESERGNPASPKKRIETRVLVKNASGGYGVSYHWNEAGTEATLAEDGGEDVAVNITVGGTPYTQQWNIPSRSQCIGCHSPQAGHALSFNTCQLNLTNTINGFTGNQLDLLRDHGYFSNIPESSNLLPRHLRPGETQYPLEARARSYLAVNCSYCHAGAAGTAPPAWDGRHELTLDQTGLINGATNQAGDPFRLIVPGDTAHSVALQRMAATGGFTRMPPLGSRETDPVNIGLVTDWINQSLPARVTYDQWRLQTFASASSPEGEPGADPDGDGLSNRAEFLAGTLARNGSSFLIPGVSLSDSNVFLNFTIPANRSVQVESSGNLADWSLWNNPANNGIALPGGNTTFSGPAIGPNQFYRLLIRER
jgi:glucose/arabinose dehydrogenase